MQAYYVSDCRPKPGEGLRYTEPWVYLFLYLLYVEGQQQPSQPQLAGAAPRLTTFDLQEAAPSANQAATLALPPLLASAGIPVPSRAAPSFVTARLPPKLVQRIENLEFIEMSELLQDAWQMDTTDGSSSRLVLRMPRRSVPITGISLWTECRAMMAAVITSKYPSKAHRHVHVPAAHSLLRETV